MSFMFGGGSKRQIMPRATPPAPKIGDGAGESAVRADRRRRGNVDDDTILTGLGSVGAQGSKISRATLLGSTAS